jgi:hypothetical protein
MSINNNRTARLVRPTKALPYLEMHQAGLYLLAKNELDLTGEDMRGRAT